MTPRDVRSQLEFVHFYIALHHHNCFECKESREPFCFPFLAFDAAFQAQTADKCQFDFDSIEVV